MTASTYIFVYFFTYLVCNIAIALLLGFLLKQFNVDFKKWMWYSVLGYFIAFIMSCSPHLLGMGKDRFRDMFIAIPAGALVGFFQAKVLSERFLKTKHWILAITLVHVSIPFFRAIGLHFDKIGRTFVYHVFPLLAGLYLGITILKLMEQKPMEKEV